MTHTSAPPARPLRLSHSDSDLVQHTLHELSQRPRAGLARLPGFPVMGHRQQPRRQSEPAALIIVAHLQAAGIPWK